MGTISTETLFKAYLAYFGRPPDTSGLRAYAQASEADVIAAFSGSQESRDLFNSVTVRDQVNSIYRNLFGRDAEEAGMSYWLGEINEGRVSLAGAALAILRGAQNEDALEVAAKYEVMQAFVGSLQLDPVLADGYVGNAAAAVARDFLSSVTGETAEQLTLSKQDALSQLPAALTRVAAAGSVVFADPDPVAGGSPGNPTLPVGLNGSDDGEASTGTEGADNLIGSFLDDGTPVDDVLEGHAGDDTMDGGQGYDWLLGGAGSDLLSGGEGDDLLDGQYGNDTLDGGDGDDLLEGGGGADRLTGGSGEDEFYFSADDFYTPSRRLAAADADLITDFVSGSDRLVLAFFGDNDFGFSGLSTVRTAGGGLDAGAFRSGPGAVGATDANQRIVYDSDTGALRYDADGIGPDTAFVVVILSGAAALDLADLSIVSVA